MRTTGAAKSGMSPGDNPVFIVCLFAVELNLARLEGEWTSACCQTGWHFLCSRVAAL